MAGFSPWSASGLLAGAGQRITIAAAGVACLWLAVLWASLGVAPPASQVSNAPTEAAPQPPAPLRAIAVAAAPAPGGGQFDRFGIEMQPAPAPVNARGDVAFFARLCDLLARAFLVMVKRIYFGSKDIFQYRTPLHLVVTLLWHAICSLSRFVTIEMTFCLPVYLCRGVQGLSL